MSVGIFFKNFILFLSLFFVAPVNGKNIHCKALDNSTVKSLFLPDTYSVNVEVKLMDGKTVNLIREDRMEGISSLKVTNITHVVHCLYHYQQKQLVTYTEDLHGRKKECHVTPLEPKTPCIPNSQWTIPLHELRQMNNFSWFPEEKEYPRGIETLHLELCEYNDNQTVYMKLDAYIAVNWMLPRSNEKISLVRLEFILPNAHVISDYIDFSTDAQKPENLLLPHGTFCPGLNISSVEPPRINVPFSVNTEIVDLNEIKNERLIFDGEKKLVLLETESRNVSSGAERVIYDYNTGYKYTISLRTYKCKSRTKIQLGDYFVKGCVGSTSCEMSDPDNYIHMDNAEIQYVGKREVRGVICNVWVGRYLDVYTEAINTIEWYYTSKSWTESVGTKQEDSVILRMDIWEPGTETPSIHNFFDFDTNPKVWSQFDISSCFSKPDEKIRFTIRLKASAEKYLLPYTTDESAVQYLRKELSSSNRISPILLTQTMVDYDVHKAVVYLTSTLLSGPKELNPKFGTKNFKSLTDAFENMSQMIRLKDWTVLLPIQLGSKLKHLQLTADKIWKPISNSEIDRTGLSTTPSPLTTAPKTPPAEHTSKQSPASKKTHRSISTAAGFTTNTLRTLHYSDNQKSETAGQTKLSIKTTTEMATTRPAITSSDASTVVQTSTLSTSYVTESPTEHRRTTTGTFTSDIPSKFKHTSSIPRETTTSSGQTATASVPPKSTGPSRTTRCVCPTTSSNSSCHTESLHEDNNLSKATFIGCVCGSFVVGMLLAFVIVSVYSVYCRPNKHDNSESHFLTDMPYRTLE